MIGTLKIEYFGVWWYDLRKIKNNGDNYIWKIKKRSFRKAE